MDHRPKCSTADFPADWFRRAIFYELSVKAFSDSDDDGWGDLRGLEQRLDYAASLGVTALWMLPIFPSPGEEDGYDVSDFRSVHPRFGTLEDLRRVVATAHARRLRIVMEIPLNRTSVEHPWFQAARRAEEGTPLRDFFVWRTKSDMDGEDGLPIMSSRRTPPWTWDEAAQAFYRHQFSKVEPDLNFASEAVRREAVEVLRFWARAGIDGFSLSGWACRPSGDGPKSTSSNSDEIEFVRTAREELSAEFPELLIIAHGEPATLTSQADHPGTAPNELIPLPDLAARLFLSLRRRDRTALVDLFRTQQDLHRPNSLSLTWLRNHDEMTAAVASDDEEDFLLDAYAGDPAQRVRGGIARRLAPMVGHDRRQMELLLSLLIALPGVPRLYYGDELGMGDNPWLGDRRGIRTPFPWTDGPNGGFSRAATERLYAPLVADPVGGYSTANVARLEREPRSLLVFVRELLKIRESFPSLADGPLVFLESVDRDVVAFVRWPTSMAPSHSEAADPLLIVANLSPSTRIVELELGAHQGRTPVELFGKTAFPPVDQSPYRLTLTPYGVIWLSLSSGATPPSTGSDSPSEGTSAARKRSIPLWPGEGPANWEALLSGKRRAAFESDILPKDLPGRRWFGAKSRTIDRVEIIDWWRPSAGEPAAVLFAKVQYQGGGDDLYLLPLSVVPATRGQAADTAATVACLSDGSLIVDALSSPAASFEILKAIEQAAESVCQSGVVRGHRTSAFPPLRDSRNQPLVPRKGPETSSNSLVFFGRKLLLKLFRRLETGINPDLEVGRFLTEHESAARFPEVAGSLEYVPSDGSGPRTLAIVQSLISSQGDGWSSTLAELKPYYVRAAEQGALDEELVRAGRVVDLASQAPPPFLIEALGKALPSASQLAKRTAELHLALAAESSDPDFAPDPLDHDDLALISREIRYQAGLGREALERVLPSLSPTDRAAAERLLEEGPDALERLEAREAGRAIPGLKTRIHGDFHLGQVLRVGDDFVLLDFEGEPTRSVAERRAKFSPIRDVAGMLRSYHYAAYAALFDYAGEDETLFDRLVPWADAWHQWISAAFVQTYRRRMQGSPVIPEADSDFAFLLDRFVLAKGLYELVYELNNRPGWVRIPLGGVSRLLFPDTAPHPLTNRPLATTTP